MTDAEIAQEYLRREEAQKKERRGDFDMQEIARAMSEEYGLYWSQIRQAVLDYTVSGPC